MEIYLKHKRLKLTGKTSTYYINPIYMIEGFIYLNSDLYNETHFNQAKLQLRGLNYDLCDEKEIPQYIKDRFYELYGLTKKEELKDESIPKWKKVEKKCKECEQPFFREHPRQEKCNICRGKVAA